MRYNLLLYVDYFSVTNVSHKILQEKWEKSRKEIIKMGNKSKQSYQYDLEKTEGNSAVMESQNISKM